MKTLKPLAIVLSSILATVALAVPGHAQIVWGTVQNMVDASDISENGTFVDAVSVNSVNGNSTTIGDTTFTDLGSQFAGSASNPNSPPAYLATDGTISITADHLANTGPGDLFGNTSTPSNAAYQNAVSYAAYISHGATEDGTISFSGLTAGDEYQVQVWAFYPDNRFNPVLSGTNSSTLVNGTGQYVLGTFEATSSTFSFDYTQGSSPNVGALINAVSLREIPEPSTWLLMGLGAVVVGGCLYRKQLA